MIKKKLILFCLFNEILNSPISLTKNVNADNYWQTAAISINLENQFEFNGWIYIEDFNSGNLLQIYQTYDLEGNQIECPYTLDFIDLFSNFESNDYFNVC